MISKTTARRGLAPSGAGPPDRSKEETSAVYQGNVVKKMKTDEVTYTYWYANWREGEKIKNACLGSTKKRCGAMAEAKSRK